jgi:hypothetical protein
MSALRMRTILSHVFTSILPSIRPCIEIAKMFPLCLLISKVLRQNFSEFNEFIDVLYKADVICLQELWRFPVYANFVLPGYSRLQYKLRGNNVQGGGVGIFVKSNLKFCVLSAESIFVDRIFESIFIKLELPNSRKCIIGSVYRPCRY